MNKNLDLINFAVSLIIKAALIAARFSGRARKRSLRRLATMDINEKDKEILFLRDMVDQLKMQATPSLFRQWLGLSRAALLQACLFAFDVFLLSISHPFLEIWDKEQSHLQPCRL